MGPIRGQTRPLPVAAGITPESQCINAKLNASIHNRFDIEVINAETGEVRRRAQAENVICNGYWSALGNACKSIAVGSGNGTPSATDSTLFTPLKSYSGLNWTWDNSKIGDGVMSVTIGPATILETELVGSTITELGYGTTSEIYTHAMLKDSNGNQVSIAKTATDIIKVYCTIFVNYDELNFNGVHIGSTPVYIAGILALAYSVNTTNVIYNFTGVDNSTDAVDSSFTNDSTNKRLVFAMARLPSSSGNFPGGISKINADIYGFPGMFETNLPATWYPGDDIIGEVIGTGDGTTTAFATDFVHATNATIYVNGVAQSGVTVTDTSTVTNNIVFAASPAAGAVITADYHTSVIAKDVNHVFDFSLVIQLGEHTT